MEFLGAQIEIKSHTDSHTDSHTEIAYFNQRSQQEKRWDGKNGLLSL